MSVSAQTLQGGDDHYGIQFGTRLQVEPLGVLENDRLNGEPAGENGASAELLTLPGSGTLSCPGNTGLALCADGSFTYTTAAGFNGLDSFTYQLVFNGGVSAPVTVKLSACTGGPDIFSCWKESAYLDQLAALGYGVFSERFEGAAWDVARSTISTPNTAASIDSQGITWTSNHPDTNNITSGAAAARTNLWSAYDPNHGVASGTPGSCDIDFPPESCRHHDGLSGKSQIGGPALHAVGAYIRGTYGAKIAVILDAGTPVNLGLAGFYEEQFLGVIDAGAGGFSAFEFRETDGKIGQPFLIFFEDFTIASTAAPSNILPIANAGPNQAVSVNHTVVLDGRASFDANGDPIAYIWSLIDKPPGSVTTLANSTTATPQFVADVEGRYTVELLVSDAQGSSTPDRIDINATAASSNILPVADAGVDQAVTTGQIVLLDGSASSDANSDPLSYYWTLIEMPPGSHASLSNSGSVSPGLTTDLGGRYVAQLVVSDAVGSSSPDTVNINASSKPGCQFIVIHSKTGSGAVICL